MTAPTLTEFLLARIAEDEAWAQARWEPSVARSGPDTAVSIRLRKECEAKRRIVGDWEKAHGPERDTRWGRDVRVGVTHALWHLATIYSDHPDYDEAWRQ